MATIPGKEVPEFATSGTVPGDGLAVSPGDVLIVPLPTTPRAGPVEGLVAEEREELPFSRLHFLRYFASIHGDDRALVGIEPTSPPLRSPSSDGPLTPLREAILAACAASCTIAPRSDIFTPETLDGAYLFSP